MELIELVSKTFKLAGWSLGASILCAAVGCSDVESPSIASRLAATSTSEHAPSELGTASSSVPPQEAREVPAPKAKPVQAAFDFGTVEPLKTHRHTFVVRNTGDAPLELSSPHTTCKCLSIESATDVIPPGGTGSVEVAWKAKAAQDAFVQRATVKTNDPRHETIEFKVLGQALLLLATDPPELVAARVKPGESAVIHGTIFSQVLDEFTLTDLSSSLDGMQWKLAPAAEAQLARVGAKSGWQIELTLPDDLPQGGFIQWLRFKAETEELEQPIDEELLTYEVPVRGKVLRRLSVFGQGIEFDGTLDVGIVKPGTEFERVLTVRVQDQLQELKVTSVETQPSFVEAHLEPFTGKKAAGMYRLRLRIPPDATPGNYRRETLGKIRLTFDHPRIDSLELGVSFVVPNERPSRLHQLSRLDSTEMTRSSP